jgi:16S rRNA (adenine1518-N6/adenine1519-N6)-dimethyltransferase
LEHGLAGVENVRLIVADVLELDLNRVTEGQPYVVVANIPYNITSVLIRKLLEAKNPPERMVLTLQREVAERIVAPAGDMSLLALGVQVYGDPSIVARIPASAFYPQPNVDSAILRVEIRDPPKVARDLIRPLFMLARAGFGQRRKQLHNALSGGLGLGREETAHLLLEAGIDPRKRAQALTVAEWGRLAQTFAKRRGEG